MYFTFFGYQIMPGSDDNMYFAPTLEDCQAAAIEQRKELMDDQVRDGVIEQLGAMAVYQVVLRSPDQAMFLKVLNKEADLFDACLVGKKLVGLIAE
jgi:hypothetical protein